MAEPWQRVNGGGPAVEPWHRRRLVVDADPQQVEPWQRVELGVATIEPWQRVLLGGTIPPQENWQLRKATT